MSALLRVRELDVDYPTSTGSVRALSRVDLAVGPGEAWGIIGETGSGKSSLIRSVVGLLPHPGEVVGGSIEVAGRDLAHLGARELRELRARHVAFMPQNTVAALNPVVRIRRLFGDVLHAAGERVSRHEARDRACELMAEAGIADPRRVADSYAFELSGGMAQRVAICLAMVRDPDLLLADEPTTGLDTTTLRQTLELLSRLTAQRGCSSVLVTHSLGVVAEYCTRVAVMYGGQVVESGRTTDVLSAPAHPYTEALLDAMPRRGRPLSALGGLPVLPATPESACVFAPRCPAQASERCLTERPPMREVGPDHRAATFCPTPAERRSGRASTDPVGDRTEHAAQSAPGDAAGQTTGGAGRRVR